MTVAGILQHEVALQISAALAAGNRLSGTPGYDRSVDYVVDRAEEAGLDVSTQDFNYTLDFLADFEPPVLSVRRGERFVPGIAGASLGGDFGSMFKSTPYGTDITAPVWAVDLVLPPGAAPNTSTSGCEASDYEGVPEGAIIIVQRVTCTFAQDHSEAEPRVAAPRRRPGVPRRACDRLGPCPGEPREANPDRSGPPNYTAVCDRSQLTARWSPIRCSSRR